MPSINRGGGALRCELGVPFPILTGFAAFLQQTLAGLRDAPTPIDRQQAEREIGTADIRPVAVVRRRGVLQTTLIAGPCFGSPVGGTTAGADYRNRIGRGDQAQGFQFAPCYRAVRSRFQDLHRGKVRRVLALEIHAARHAGGPGSTWVGTARLAQPPGQIRPAFSYRYPGLMIPGTGSQDQKSGAPHALQHSPAEIVQLDQPCRGPLGPHDQILPALDSRPQQRRHPAPERLYALRRTKAPLVPIHIGPREIEAVDAQAGKQIQHLPSLLYPPPVFL